MNNVFAQKNGHVIGTIATGTLLDQGEMICKTAAFVPVGLLREKLKEEMNALASNVDANDFLDDKETYHAGRIELLLELIKEPKVKFDKL